MKKFVKLTPLKITIFAIFTGSFAFLYGIPFMDIVELKTIDLRFTIRGKISSGTQVILAVIDEKSLEKEGKWTWPRSKMADLVNKLSKAGAKVIGFDIGFFEPDDKIVQTINTIQLEVQHSNIENQNLEHFLEDLRHKSDNDQLLTEAIKNSKSRVVLGYFFHMDLAEVGHPDESEMLAYKENIRGSRYKLVRYASAEAKNIELIQAKMPQSNIKIISSASDYSGFFNTLSDPDGTVRRIPSVFEFKDMLYAPLSLVLVGAYLDAPISVNIADHGVEEISIGKLSIPTDEQGQILINYRGPEKTFPYISITDILNENVPEDVIKNKIVLVGATAIGIPDLRVTPFGTNFPGIEIHANVVDSILANDFLHQPAWTAIFDLTAIIVAGLFLGIFLRRAGVISGFLAGAFLIIGYTALCQYLFSAKEWILNLVYPLSVFVFIYVFITTNRYLSESKQKKFIKNAFSTYLAPSVVSQLIQSPEKLVLGGEKRIITAFFSDVQGFTSISEKLEPKELVELLNIFLTEMTDIILSHEGTVDKFEGDAIIAFFGAPNPLPNHAEVGCRACIEMQKRLAELRSEWKTAGKPKLKMRIGLSTGSAVVGNMGSRNRMDYTMMGDTVNTAARLEGVNKTYGIYTLISDSTYKATDNKIMVREIDYINVVGKKEPITIYEILGFPGEVNERMLKTTDHYTKALDAYRYQDWDRAIMLLNKAIETTPNDGPSKTMIGRCNEYKINPPDKNWDGIYAMTVK